MKRQWEMTTSFGKFYLLASNRGLHAVGFKKFDAEFIPSLSGSEDSTFHLNQAVQQISEYLQGQRKALI